MTLQWYLLEADHDPGTAAETVNRDLPRAGITKALVFNMPALAESTGGQTVQQLGAQLDQIRIGAIESNKVSEIDGEDLFNWNIVNDNHPFVNTSTTDNAVVQIGMTYALDPFCIGSYVDYNQKFGISANVARKVEILYGADVSAQVDGKNLAIGAIVKDQADQDSTGGYITFTRDAYTAANNVNNFTTVPIGGQLIGAFCFETNDTASGQTALRTANDIQQQAIAINRKDVAGPVYPDMCKDFNGQYELGSIGDEGYWFWNFGIRNEVGAIGRPTQDKMEIRSLGGSDAGAVRVYAARLNNNT